jgi:hypothetical protein
MYQRIDICTDYCKFIVFEADEKESENLLNNNKKKK